MDTMRMESGFLHWGHDISPEENQFEAKPIEDKRTCQYCDFSGICPDRY